MNVDIASRLAKLRKKYGYSQESLAERLGISRQAVSKWERAEASPDTDNLITLAKLYGVSLDDLLNTDKDIPEAAQTARSAGGGDDAGGRGSYGYSVEFNDDAEEKTGEKAREGSSGENRAPFSGRGIHFEDGGDRVHLGWDGIYVEEKGGKKVNVSWKGVHVEAPGEDVGEVHVGLDGVYVKDADGRYRAKAGGDPVSEDEKADDYREWDEWEDWVGNREKNLFQRLPLGIIALVAFLLLGFVGNLWHPGWMVFLLIPVADSFITAVVRRDPHRFAYPFLALDAFLWLGMMHGLWHPAWVAFLTVPIFYAIFPAKKKKVSGGRSGK